jgi:hypothetical protein
MKGMIFGDSGPEIFFDLKEVIVSIYDVNKEKKYKSQMVMEKFIFNVPNLFGLDLLERIKGKITLDFKNNSFLLEW